MHLIEVIPLLSVEVIRLGWQGTSQMLLLQTTGLTGLAVANNPHHTLTVLYGKILRALQKMPSSAAYRKYTEEIINERAQIVKNVS